MCLDITSPVESTEPVEVSYSPVIIGQERRWELDEHRYRVVDIRYGQNNPVLLAWINSFNGVQNVGYGWYPVEYVRNNSKVIPVGSF